MADLLLHSMAEFAEIIFPALEIAGAKDVVEVGAEHGTMTRNLIEHTRERGGSFRAVDPAPSPQVEALFAEAPHAELLREPSLAVLDGLAADAYLVDGDHNYYTVLHESKLIWRNARAAGRPFLVFYHDVGWPCARRDMYYAPGRIPEEYRRPHTWEEGVAPGEPGVIRGGFRGDGLWACALQEGGPRNGVLTAIEDFVAGKEERLVWACVPAVFGLGVLYAKDAPWTDALSAFLRPYHMNPLLARLERNRLACYLRVIEMQDERHAQCA